MLKIDNLKKPRDAGQALVEFALAIMVLIPILFVIIDFGWITYQRVIFEYGYMHASWEISAKELEDDDPLEADPSIAIYTGSLVTNKLRSEIIKTTAGIIDSNLDVSGVTAKLYNETDKNNYTVPSSTFVPVEAFSRTRYMELTATLTYTIHPLTPIGDLIFGSNSENLIMKEILTRTRVVASQHRSA